MAKKLPRALPSQLRSLSIVVSLGAVACTAGMAGCSSDGSQSSAEDPAIVARRDTAGNQLQASLTDVEQQYETCVDQLASTGTCVLPGNAAQGIPDVVITDPTIQGLGDAIRIAREKVAQVKKIFAQIGNNICDVIGPFSSLNNPYFYYGGYVQAGAVGQVQGGVDMVWDMTNLQAATFGYKGYGVASLVGGEAGAYAGYGFGKKDGVIDAWSGRFCSASVSVGLPAKLLSAGATGFVSPDLSVYGGAVSISVGYDVIPTPVDASVFAADWTAWDTGTKALSQNGFFIHQHLKKDPSTGKTFIQYDSPKDMALALLWNAPAPMGVAAAAQVIALDFQKKSGLSIEQMCPKQAAQNAVPKPVADLANKACSAPPPIDKIVKTVKDKVMPKPKEDAGAPPPQKDSCVGRADGLYCSQLVDFSAFECTGGAISGGEQCPGGMKCAGPNGPGTMIVCN